MREVRVALLEADVNFKVVREFIAAVREKALGAQSVEVVIGADGAICFKGWAEASRRSVTDVCAYLTLSSRGSWDLRQAVARAETRTGRSVNRDAVTAGRHSHDGGGTWSVD